MAEVNHVDKKNFDKNLTKIHLAPQWALRICL